MRFVVDNFYSDVSKCISSTKNHVAIFSPYMTLNALKKITEQKDANVNMSIFLRLEIRDLIFGATDKDIYRYAIDNNIYCYINNDLHMKAYIYDWDSIHTGSANCTMKGLGISKNPNYEFLIFNRYIPSSFIKFCSLIQSKSILLKNDVLSVIGPIMEKEIKIGEDGLKRDFSDIDKLLRQELTRSRAVLASQMPFTENIEDLYIFLTEKKSRTDKVELLNHDIDLFGLQNKKFKSLEEFKDVLLTEFMKIPFVSLIFSRKETSLNFGTIRKIFEKECIDDPRPSRLEVNVLINNLFLWLEKLSGKLYRVERPNHTKILYK